MLKRGMRLGRRDLDEFFKNKTKFTPGKIISLRFCKNHLKHSRFAFVVSFEDKQKRKGRAVLRNLLRRRMSEIIRKLTDNIDRGYDIVLFIKLKGQMAANYANLKDDIIYVLSRSHLSRSIL